MGFSSNQKKGPISDINVTPLVDVMLVLLVIFMITAPLLLNGIKLDLPKTRETNRINLNSSQVVLSYTTSEEYYIGKEKVLFDELIGEIKGQFKKNKSDVLYLRADYNLRYGKLAKLMSYLKSKGVSKIALVTETDTKDAN